MKKITYIKCSCSSLEPIKKNMYQRTKRLQELTWSAKSYEMADVNWDLPSLQKTKSDMEL